jgi:hypothetical protein
MRRIDSSVVALAIVTVVMLWMWWTDPTHDASGLVQVVPFLVVGAALSYFRFKVERTPAVTRMVDRIRPEVIEQLPPEAAPKLAELRALADKGRSRRLSVADDKRALQLLREIAAIERDSRRDAHRTAAANPPAAKNDDDSFRSIWDEEPSIWNDER